MHCVGSVTVQALIYDECIATLCALGNQMGPRFITFDSLISRSIEGMNSLPYYTVICFYRILLFTVRIVLYESCILLTLFKV